ncbi:MAG TPA: hypothetical protein VEZ90_07485 [Blastocatellia bacterium]|nr:hypothetical protein [Blastocatellia bacterium]
MSRQRRPGRKRSKRSGRNEGPRCEDKLHRAGGPPGDDGWDGGPERKKGCGHCRFPVTRQFGLLVRDQDILDLIWRSTLSEVDILAERFVAVQDAIDRRDIGGIDHVSRESPDFLFRRIVGALKRGTIDGDWWCAGYTARVIVGEAFSKSPDYFQALRFYCDDLRMERRRSGR